MSYNKERYLEAKEFLDAVLAEAKKKNFHIVASTTDMLGQTAIAFSGPMTILHGMIENLELEVRCLHINNIQKRRRDEQNDKSVGDGDSRLREGQGVVGETHNPS